MVSVLWMDLQYVHWGAALVGERRRGGEEKGLVEFRALVPTMYSGLISLLFLYLEVNSQLTQLNSNGLLETRSSG